MTFLLTNVAARREWRGGLAWLSGSRVLSMTTILILYFVLGFLYDHVVAPRYAFGSFRISSRQDGWIEIVTVLIAGLALPTETIRMSQIFAWLSTVFLLIPAAVLSVHQGSDRYAMFLMFGGVWLVMWLSRLLMASNIFAGINITPARARIGIGWMLAVQVAVLFALAVHVGGRMNFSFADVYEYRFDFNRSLIFPLNYILPFTAGPLAGLIIASALYKRTYTTILFVIFAGILFFGLSSHKALLFYPVFAIAIYIVISKRVGHIYLMGIFLALALATLLAASTAWGNLLGSTFANRLVFIPEQIHYYFFREFGEIGPQLWAESRIGLGLHRSNIPLPSVNYIGLMMTGDPEVGANTGWIANGYMNGGWVGIAVYAIILSATLHIIDRLGNRYGYNFVGAAFVIPIINIINSTDLLVGFLTGGLLLLFFVFFWLVRADDQTGAAMKTAR
jgi:hypothetical protein